MEQIQSVERILEDLDLNHIPQIRGLNKLDLVPHPEVSRTAARLKGIPICAQDPKTLMPLIDEMSRTVERLPRFMDSSNRQ
jgi:50S ribosomal subunit-associated GTPase HflX